MILACCHQYAIVCFGAGHSRIGRRAWNYVSWNFHGTSMMEGCIRNCHGRGDASKNAMW